MHTPSVGSGTFVSRHAVMQPSHPIIVLRGDLYSDTGYGRATRALGEILRTLTDRTFATSIHEHKARRQNSVDFPVVSDAQLVADPTFRNSIVVNVCLPDSFIRVQGATNIGYFFWETARLPTGRFWKSNMQLMDRLWAPSKWQSEYLRSLTGRAHVAVVPWPLDEPTPVPPSCAGTLGKIGVHGAMSPDELDNYLLRISPLASRRLEKDFEEAEHAAGHSSRFSPDSSPRFADICERDGDLFVAIQTDAPRKGLPLLLSNWMRFKTTREGRHAKLVIKMSSLDVYADLFRIHFHASLAVRRACSRLDVENPDIWFMYARLSSDEMRMLLRKGDALVSSTLGEGFGGPLAEAIIEGTPVIAPDHTSILDILGKEYPLAVTSKVHNLRLWNNIDVYSPSSPWHVIDDASFLECMLSFTRMRSQDRRALAERTRAQLMAGAGFPAVRATLHRELGGNGPEFAVATNARLGSPEMSHSRG